MIRYLPATHSDLLDFYGSIADIYEHKNQLDDALKLLYECLQKQEIPPERSARDRAFTYRRIAKLHEKQGHSTRAKEMMQKCKALEASNSEPFQIDWNKVDDDSVLKNIFNIH